MGCFRNQWAQCVCLQQADFRLQWFVYRFIGWSCIVACLQEVSHLPTIFGHFTIPNRIHNCIHSFRKLFPKNRTNTFVLQLWDLPGSAHNIITGARLFVLSNQQARHDRWFCVYFMLGKIQTLNALWCVFNNCFVCACFCPACCG